MVFKKSIPNLLTILRIAIIPVIVLTFYFDDKAFAHRLATFLFLFACTTDFLDGFLARKLGCKSKLGEMLDPIADKLLISAIMVMLVKFDKAQEIPCLLILSREIAVTGLREFLAKSRIDLPVTRLAKIKTAIQMIAISILLLGDVGSNLNFVNYIGSIMLWGAAILTVITGYTYFQLYNKL